MSEPIDHLYFNWLRAKVVDVTTPPRLYLDLMRILYRTEFVWTIYGDKNREEEGLQLRNDFLQESGEDNDLEWYHMPCSVFELLIGLAKRASFQTDDPVRYWFWKFLENLGLNEYRHVSRSDERLIAQILEIFVFRMYDESGYGGLFPLREPKENQKEVELWYQFCHYVEDQDLI